jgi:hypothetical protein
LPNKIVFSLCDVFTKASNRCLALLPLGVPQNAIDMELCLRITNGKPALAHLIDGGVRANQKVKCNILVHPAPGVAVNNQKMKIQTYTPAVIELAPLLTARAM